MGRLLLVSDEQLIASVLRGETENYRELMCRHQAAVFGLAYRILGRREDAEDAVQESFVQAYSRLGECRKRSRFGAWVRRIAANICLRRLPRDIPADDLDELAGDDDPVVDEIIRRAEARRINDAITSLPAPYRTVLVLRYHEELSLGQVAELLGERPGAIYTRLHRARRMLAQRLEVFASEM